MTISWRGLGYLGFMIPMVFWALSCTVFGLNNFKAMRVAFLLSAVVVWFVGRKLNASGPDADGEVAHQTFGASMEKSIWLPVVAFFLTFA